MHMSIYTPVLVITECYSIPTKSYVEGFASELHKLTKFIYCCSKIESQNIRIQHNKKKDSIKLIFHKNYNYVTKNILTLTVIQELL